MTIKLLDDANLWDSFVDESPYGLLFHRWDFLQIIEKYSGFKAYPFGVYRGDELICVFPLFYRSYGGLRMVFSPPPGVCIPYLGPVLGSTYDSLRQRRKESYVNSIVEEIQGEIDRFAPHYVSINAVPGFEDVRPFMWTGYTALVTHTYVLDIRRPEQEIWMGIDSKCRKAIKSCSKLPLSLQETRDARRFYDIMKDRFAGMGMNCPLPCPDYLVDMLDAFPGQVRMYFLYLGDEIASIAMNTEHKGRLMFWLGDTRISEDIPGNKYAKWEFIKDARARGLKEIDFEGATMPQLCMFKSQFNPELKHSYVIHRKSFTGNIAEWAYRNMVMKKAIGIR